MNDARWEISSVPVMMNAFPSLYAILQYQSWGNSLERRAIRLDISPNVDSQLLTPALAELSEVAGGEALTVNEIALIAVVANKWLASSVPKADQMVEALRALVERRRAKVAVPLACIMLTDIIYRHDLQKCLPVLTSSPVLVEALIRLFQENVAVHLDESLGTRTLEITDLDQLRRALPLTAKQPNKSLGITFISAAVRVMGWSKWLKLQTILFEYEELAGDEDVEQPAPISTALGDYQVNELWRSAWQHLVGDESVREVAQLVIDLDGALAYAAPDVRGVYVRRLQNAIAGDTELRVATIEALLLRSHRHQDLGLYAATALTLTEDEPFIASLTSHPNREVSYRARMLHEAVFGDPEPKGAWPRPTLTGIAEGLFQLRLEAVTQEQPRTWLGDRLLERMIEHTAASEEERFAREYHNQSESDEEEGLLRILFSNLEHQFAQLDQGLLATARARRSDRRTRVRISYRTVSKSEEGKAGISRTGNDADAAKKFSADLCLIVAPFLEGKPLPRRATLVQAKRLYRRDRYAPEKGFAASYMLKPQQIDNLLEQTASSFYLFQGPGGAGRGVPILPTQLVSDLAAHQAASRNQIEHAVTSAASWSFAEWLTYEVLALRTGDPLEELLEKASGGDGRRPRQLGRFGTVEIEVRASEPLKEGE